MHIPLNGCEVRSWRPEDADSVARHADDHEIWRNMRDAFPHPYKREHAVEFIRLSLSQRPESRFAIAVSGEAVGGIGFQLHEDIERVSAELGYWLSARHWGRGIATQAVKAVTGYAIAEHGLARVFAVPFTRNAASCRVLEKAGYVLECCMRRSAIKEGEVIDQMLYAFVP